MQLNGIPALGCGTYPLTAKEAEATVAMVLEVGHRHIDTAQLYGNEADVGRGLKRAGLPRGDVFVTTKVDQSNYAADHFLPSVRASLDKLQLAEVDLLLLHWPPTAPITIEEAVDRLNAAVEQKLCRMIGISNFTIAMAERAVARSHHPLVTNQVEFHPLLDQSKLRTACAAKGMTLSAYCPLARGRVLGSPVTSAIAEAHGVSEGAVVLRWIIQQGVVALPMTTKRANAEGNLRALSITLTADEMASISALTSAATRLVSPAMMRGVWDT